MAEYPYSRFVSEVLVADTPNFVSRETGLLARSNAPCLSKMLDAAVVQDEVFSQSR